MTMKSTLPGRWTLRMRTPIGSINAEMTFTTDGQSTTGTAAGKTETVPLRDIRTTADEQGEHVTWSQSITKPLRLDLDFDVTILGDKMHGHSRAGRLPRSTVVGQRIND